MSRTIIDITELVNWRGGLTGVPRVMYELSTRFNSQNSIYVAWNGSIKKYQQVELKSVLKQIIFHSKNKSNNQPHSNVKKIIRLVPGTLFVHKYVKSFLKYLRDKTAIIKVYTGNSIYYPASDDVIFILADWHAGDSNFGSYLIELKSTGIRIAQFCHDLLPLVTPQYSGHSTDYLQNYVFSVYPICDLIISNSENTKQDIIKVFKTRGLKEPKISVIRLGDDFERKKPQAPPELSLKNIVSGNEKFSLCVGTIEARKNHTLLYYAYKLASRKGIELPRLIIVGRKGWQTDDIYTVMTKDPEITEKITFLHNASDEHLAWLYSHCLFTIYPSFYEGWGLPIAESISYGSPCIASSTSSMPEIAGNLIEYFDPSSPEECVKSMIKLMNPKENKIARSKIKSYKTTTWDNTYSQVDQVLRTIR